MRRSIISMLVIASSFGLHAEDSQSFILGSGEPSLGIIYNSTNEYVIFIDEGAKQSWKPGDYLDVDYRNVPLNILAARNFGAEKLSTYIPLWNTEHLYPFDEQTVFTSFGDPQNRKGHVPRETQIFSTNEDGILISRDVDALARARYGLTTNQWFLGKLGTNIYYSEIRKPNIVFFRPAKEKQAANYFKLPRGGYQIYGVTKAMSSNKDVGMFGARTLSWYELSMNSSAQAIFVEFALKDANQVKNAK